MADVAASVLARLKNKAAKSGRSYQLCLQLFCQEEFLRRLEKSKYAENLVLKGGLFLYSLTDFDSRVTADVDFLLRKMPNTPEQLDFMESFIAELEAERVAELSAYLTVSGLDNYELSSDEENALKNYQSLKWDTYNLEKLFGKSTRGKRLKGDDRIAGTLPFVTAGEASEGISAYISNEVEVFEKNTTTIDMFGSAKYRNYIYGGDDHIAVVHTENLPKYASIFVTTAIHKSSHNGQFDYGHNFYAKDADVLYISLPVNEAGNPDYDKMAIIISAIHKLVIKDVVAYSNRKIKATKAVVK